MEPAMSALHRILNHPASDFAAFSALMLFIGALLMVLPS
jgi:hypothetical protein